MAADTLRRLLLAGLGAVDLSEEKARAIFNDLVTRGEMSEKDAKEVLNDWGKRATEQRSRLQQEVEQGINKTFGALGYVKKDDLETLRAKIEELESRLAAQKAAQG